jgi:hypothetical protein
VLVRVNVDNPADKITEFGAGAKLYWYRDNTSATGPFTDATGFVALDPAQTQYEIIDSTGVEGHYYRTRVGNTGGTLFDAYAPVFQAGAKSAYATLDASRELLDFPDDTPNNVVSDLLIQASSLIEEKCGGRRFYRSPQVSGTEIRTYDSSDLYRNGTTLVEDIVSLTTVELAWLTGGSFTALAGTDWFLYPARPDPGWPYTELRLSDVGSRYTFPAGYRVIRLTGVFGWPAIPPVVEAATREMAQELYWKSRGGRQVGLEFGRLPTFVDEAVRIYRREPWVYGAPALAASWP